MGEYSYLVNNTTGLQIPRQAGEVFQGLVHRHISDRKYHPIKIALFKNMMQVHVPRAKNKIVKNGKRSVITEFSKQSRSRMLRLIHKIKNHDNGYFMHLTYPSDFNATPEDVKIHLANLRKRLTRRFEGIGVIWRLELKRRKSGVSVGQIVPHFHLLLFGVTDEEISKLGLEMGLENKSRITILRLWVARAWNSIAGDGDLDHLKAGTRVDKMENMRHAAAYASKYAAKDEDDTPNEDEYQNWGRRWGRYGNLDTKECLSIYVQHEDVPHLKRMLRGILIGRSRKREREAIRTGKPYRHKKNRGFWRNVALKSDKFGCAILGIGEADTGTMTRLLFDIQDRHAPTLSR